MDLDIKRVDHWGIVAGIMKDLGVIALVDEQIKSDKREILTNGQIVAGLVINGLGFASRPLMLSPQFFEGKALEILFEPGIKAEHFNRHRIGRALDEISAFGCEKLFNFMAISLCAQEGVETKFAHADTTSIALHGEYKTEEVDEKGNQIEQKLSITYGYSKDKRPDLKQVVQELVTSSDGGIPFITKTLSGDESDSTILRERAAALIEEFKASGPRCLVADSKLYAKGTADTLNKINFITRVPASLKQEQEFIYKSVNENNSWIELSKGYKYQEFESSVYNIENQRWLVFYSPAAHDRAIQTVGKEVEKEHSAATKECSSLGKKSFSCEKDAREALAALSKKWVHHFVSGSEIIETKVYKTAGRPNKDTPYDISYQIKTSVLCDKEVGKKVINQRSCFILATNLSAESSGQEILDAYKGQDYTEKGFAFLKKPEFFTSALNLEKPGRIEAVLMIMVLSLVVYTLAQRRLRKMLSKEDQTIPNQLKKPIKNPTMRWIFQLFEGVNFVTITIDGVKKKFVEGLNDLRRQVIKLLGGNIFKIYHTSVL